MDGGATLYDIDVFLNMDTTFSLILSLIGQMVNR